MQRNQACAGALGSPPKVAVRLMQALLTACLALPGAMAIASDSGAPFHIDVLAIGTYWLDETAGVDFADLAARNPDWRRLPEQRQINLGITDAALWVRVSLPWTMQQRHDLVLVVPVAILDSIAVFHVREGVTAKWSGGDGSAYAERPRLRRHYQFPLPASDGDATLYIRVQSDSALRFRAYISDELSVERAESRAMLVLGVFYGLMLGLFMYNLLLIVLVYDLSRVYYLGYLACASMIAAIVDGFPAYFALPGWPAIANAAAVLIAHALLFSGLGFVRTYLRVRDSAPRLHRALQASAVAVVASGLGATAIGGTGAQRMLYAAVAMTIVVISYCIVRQAFSGSRPARVLAVTFAALAVPTMLWTGQAVGIVEFATLGEFSLHLGFALEGILLSFALADRINDLAAQRLHAERELAAGKALLSRRVIEAREQQQQNFARELHDAVGQNILALKARLDRWSRTADAAAASGYAEASAIAAAAISATRELAHQLHPSVLDRLGLVEALTMLGETLADHDIVTTIALHDDLGRIDRRTALNVYRIFQEAVANVARHSEARNCTLRSFTDALEVVIELEDDGGGIAHDAVAAAGIGILSMQERAQTIGATLTLTRATMGGTRVTVRLARCRDANAESQA